MLTTALYCVYVCNVTALYHGNKVSWYPVLSKFVKYVLEDRRLFVDLL